MNGTRECLTLGQDGETIAQVCHVVLSLNFVSVERCVTLKRQEYICYKHYDKDYTYLEDLGRVVLCDRECGRLLVNCI